RDIADNTWQTLPPPAPPAASPDARRASMPAHSRKRAPEPGRAAAAMKSLADLDDQFHLGMHPALDFYPAGLLQLDLARLALGERAEVERLRLAQREDVVRERIF